MRKNISLMIIMTAAATAILFVLLGCGASSKPAKPSAAGASSAAAAVETKGPVTVATMIDSEGAVLGKMLVLLLRAEGFEVVDKTEFGTPDILRKALEAKEVDLVIDYTGSGQYYHEGFDPAIWSDPVKGYEKTRDLDKEKKNIWWLTPAPANNTEMLAVKRDFAAANGLGDMQSFAAYVNKGGKVKLICAQSFADNKLGLLGYEAAYGFKLRKDQLILLSSGNTAEMLKALYEGTDGVNVSLVYGTDGALEKMNLLVLKDTKNVPPVYLPAPVLRGELAEKYPVLENLFKPLFESLTLETLQKLNAGVAFDGKPPEAAARDYLESKGFLKK
jgi:osmoprotectant transport system substrate-binding protein